MGIYINLKSNNINYKELKKPAETIRRGGIVIFPTETVYGIGTNGLDEKAVKKLYELKKRPLNKPISLLVGNMEMIKKVTKGVNELEYKIMEKFFPGPLTIILKKSQLVPDILTANRDTVGIRMPAGKISRKLVEYAGVPIAAPSANISGNPSGTSMEHIQKEFSEGIEFFIDGGKSKLGLASTIVKIENGKPKILRQGSIRKEEIDCL